MDRSSDGDPNGNPRITGGSHPKCEECGSKIVPHFTSFGFWYHCKNCGHNGGDGSVEQVAEL